MSLRKSAPYIAGTLFVVYSLDFVPNRPILDRLQVENISKVAPGMTLAEVEQLLGGPPGEYPTRRVAGETYSQLRCTIRPRGTDGWTYLGNCHPLQSQGKCWQAETRLYTFYFEEGRAVGYFHDSMEMPHPTRPGILGEVLKLPISSQSDTMYRTIVFFVLGVVLIVSILASRRAQTPDHNLNLSRSSPYVF